MPDANAIVRLYEGRTGASGYVASHVVRELLSRGATTHATVRDPRAPGHTLANAASQPGGRLDRRQGKQAASGLS